MSDFGPTEEAAYNATGSIVAKEDMSATAPAPAAATFEMKDAVAVSAAREENSSSRITAETKAMGKANRKKRRNPDVLKLSQTKKLKSLLRSE
jgi:hypothetical protein